MCKEISRRISPNLLFGIALLLGVLTGWFNSKEIFAVAVTTSLLFMNFSKLGSLPISFLSSWSTAAGMDSLEAVKHFGQKVVKYTLLTTVLAASIALTLFIAINPVGETSLLPTASGGAHAPPASYLSFFVQIV